MRNRSTIPKVYSLSASGGDLFSAECKADSEGIGFSANWQSNRQARQQIST